MPYKTADMSSVTTDEHLLQQASRHASELCAEYGSAAKLKWISAETKAALLTARNRLDDVVADLDFDIKQLQASRENADYRAEQRSVRMDYVS